MNNNKKKDFRMGELLVQNKINKQQKINNKKINKKKFF